MQFRALAVTAAMSLAGLAGSAATAGAATYDLGSILANGGYELGSISQWTVTKPNGFYEGSIGTNFGVNKTITPLNPLFTNGTTLPALLAPDGDDFVVVANPTQNGDIKGKLSHVAVAQSFLAGDIFTVTVWGNRGRLGTNGNRNSVFSGADPDLNVSFMGWASGSTPTVSANNDNWSRTKLVSTTSAFTNWGDAGEWESQTFTFTTLFNLSYISLAISGLNDNHDQYVAWDIADPANAVAPVPEPASLFLLGTGLIGVTTMARRRLKK